MRDVVPSRFPFEDQIGMCDEHGGAAVAAWVAVGAAVGAAAAAPYYAPPPCGYYPYPACY